MDYATRTNHLKGVTLSRRYNGKVSGRDQKSGVVESTLSVEAGAWFDSKGFDHKEKSLKSMKYEKARFN